MSQNLKEIIKTSFREIISEHRLSSEPLSVELEIPKEKKFGDWSVNLAMRLASECKKPPLEIASFLVECIKTKFKALNLMNKIEKIEIKPPGFINIFLSNQALYDVLGQIVKSRDDFGRCYLGDRKKVLIEFVSANPTGPLSIAHARQAAVGDSLANILEFCGYEISREYYINDEGNQIRNLGLSLLVRYLEILGYEDIKFPEQGYKGDYLKDYAREIKKEDLRNIDINSLAKNFNDAEFSADEKTISFFSNYGISKILQEIKTELSEFGVLFDQWYSQKNHITQKKIDDVLKELKDKDFIYEKDKATWFASTKFGDDKDRVIIRSDGRFTYLAPDIAYHKLKFERGFNKLINIFGPDHHGYINRLKAAVCALGHSEEDVSILIIQLASLFRYREPVVMSTRAGEYITLKALMEEVGKDAARFFFLMRKCDSHLEFDLELAKEQSLENPVYYVQYAYARISGIRDVLKSVLERTGYSDLGKFYQQADLFLLKEKEELDLIRKLNGFSEVIENCAFCLDPQSLTTYLRELAGDFHSFYNKFRVIVENDDRWQLTKARFFLVECVRQVIFNGLRLLGVTAPDKM